MKLFASSQCRLSCLLSLGGLLLVLGCAGEALVSQEECEIGDWETLGRRDGSLGRPGAVVGELQEACVEYGVTLDRESYLTGWTAGAREYCLPSNGFAVGERGDAHADICPDDLRASFVEAFEQGHVLHEARRRVSELKSSIETKAARLENIQSELDSTAAAQQDSQLTPTRRDDLAAKLERLNDEKTAIQQALPKMRLELVDLERELAQLEHNTSSAGN